MASPLPDHRAGEPVPGRDDLLLVDLPLEHPPHLPHGETPGRRR